MPLYDYECDACGHRVELQRKIADRNGNVLCSCGGAMDLRVGSVTWWEKKHPRLITEAQVVSERGKDWRETKGSIRMARGESERSYSMPARRG